MNYFCASCQRRYDIGDIAADFYEICAPDIVDRLNEMSLKWDEDEQSEKDVYKYRLIYFCQNQYELAGTYFTIKGNEAEKRLLNATRTGLVVRGRFVLTLKWLVNAYIESGAWNEDVNQDTNLSEHPVDVFAGDLNREIYNNEIQLVYGQVGKNGELVLDHYLDGANNPFAATDGSRILRGFRRCCPHCGRHLPVAVGRAPEVVVALAGAMRSGKTSGIVSMASSLKSGKYQKFGLSMDTFNNDSQWDFIRKQIEEFDKGHKVEKTDTTISEALSYSMLVTAGKTKRVLTFVDMPGEFWQDARDDNGGVTNGNGLTEEFFKQYSGLYENIDCIWFFISKLIAYGIDLGTDGKRTDVQEALVAESSEFSGTGKPESPDNLNANLRLLSEQLRANGRKMPPCAVILTKSEVDVSDVSSMREYSLFPVEGAQKASAAAVASANAAELKKVFVPDGGGHYHLGESDFFAFAVKTRNFFARIAPGILNAFEQNLKHRFYIAASFYGHRAVDERTEREPFPPTPYHELFPLVWTLAITAAIPVSHSCVWNTKNIFGAFKKSDEGMLSPSFNANAYIYDRQPSTGSSAERADTRELNHDIAANLLMEGQNLERTVYKQTVFDHKRK